MIYIGVTGKSGAGKTTFADFLAQKSNVGVIHFDDIVDQVKLKYFRFFLDKKKNDEKNGPVKLNNNWKKRIYGNKFTFKLLMRMRDRLTRKEFQKRMMELRRQGKDIIVVDDWMLVSHKDLCSKCKKIYVVSRRFNQRRKGLKERDNASIEEAKIVDLPFALGYAKKPVGPNVEVINNYGNLEELHKVAEEKYEEIGILGFDEKYQIKDKGVHARLRQVSKETKVVNDMLHKVGKVSKEKEKNS